MNIYSTTNKTVIITGGNSGLGYECAKRIALVDPEYQIVIAGRSLERITQATEKLKRETNADRFTPIQLDLGSLASIRNFAKLFPSMGLPPLHALICNAGVQFMNQVEQSSEGYEATFAINYLGHFLLTNLMLEHLVDSSTIVVLSSISHDEKAKTPLPKPVMRRAELLASPLVPEGEQIGTFVKRAYTTSKLCILMFAYELERRLKAAGRKGISVNVFDPGGMKTGMMRDWHPASKMALNLIWPVLRLAPNTSTPANSAKVLADLAVSLKYRDMSGKYFSMIGSYRSGARLKRSSEVSYDKQIASDLWEESEKLTSFSADKF